MQTKIISTEGLLVIFILYGISVPNFPLSGQNADNLLLKNFGPVSIYKIPVTHVDKAAYPVIDVHSHDYAKTDGEIVQWLKNMDACGIEKSIVLTQTSGPKFDTIYNLYAKYGDRFEVWCGFDYTGYDKPGYGPAAVKELERCYKMGARGVGEEGDYIIPYLLMKPDRPSNKALIYLRPSGKSAEAFVGGEMEWFVRNGFTVLAPDLIGIGEMGPGDFRGDSYIEGVSYNLWFASILIGRSIVGIRAGDVVRLTRLLKKTGGISEVYGFARKEMAPVLLHAAAFDSAITRIALIEPYSSYRSIVMNRFYDPKFLFSTVPGALKAYDLPDLAASLAPRKLLMAGIGSYCLLIL